MKKSQRSSKFAGIALTFLSLGCSIASAHGQPHADVYMYSTLPSTTAHSPQLAMDGDSATYFKSVGAMGDGDDFIVMLSHQIRADSISIDTGDSNGDDTLTAGFFETSDDGVHYGNPVSFDASGHARWERRGRKVQSLRIRLNPGQSMPSLVLREIHIQAQDKFDHVMLGPGRGFVDITKAPDVEAWAQRAETQMEAFWPDTAAMLYSTNFITPNMVNVVYRTGPHVTGIAATGGGVMEVNADYVRKHPDDTGLTVHETAHVVQAYNSYNPVWLVEGIADYIRWVKFEPEHFHPRINVARATYHDAYQTSATFLAWCEMHYDSSLVNKLSRAVRFGHYSDSMFQTYCGKSVDDLWKEFTAAYTQDPAHIITLVTPAADLPRLIPVAAPNSSTPVDISSLYDQVAFVNDGKTFKVDGGADGGGAAFPAAMLSHPAAWKNVIFQMASGDSPNAVTSRGSKIALPASNFGSLWMLASAVQGSQTDQTIVVSYTDGTVDTLSQNFSDWFTPQGFPGEARAFKTPYRNMADGSKDPRTFYVYGYGFSINPGKVVQSLTLPNNPSVEVYAISLAK